MKDAPTPPGLTEPSPALHTRTVRALSWSFAEAIIHVGTQFVVGVVLARLLFPEQFGLIGMLSIFIAVSRTFLDSGFGAALIQKREVTQTDISSVFYFNVAVGIFAAGLLSFAATWIAEFYRQPMLVPLTRALSLTIVINSIGMIHRTLLTKEISFRSQTVVGLAAGALSGLIGIGLAWWGAGVWSLVAQQIASATISTACLWVVSSWRPALAFSLESLSGMFGFGSRLLVSAILNQIFDNIYMVVIGRLFSAGDLGYFARAKTLNDLPSQTLSGMVARVTLPVFSTIQHDTLRIKRGMRKALTALAVVNFPLMIGLAAVARPLVEALLTDKWLPCVPYLQWLCLTGLLYPLHLINLNVLQALGRSDLFLRLEIVKKALIVASIVVTWRWGISAMVEGLVVVSAISYYLNSHYNRTLVDYSFTEQVRDLQPYLLVASLMGVAVHAIGLLPIGNSWALLAIQVPAGAVLYAAMGRLFKLDGFVDLWEAIRLAGGGKRLQEVGSS